MLHDPAQVTREVRLDLREKRRRVTEDGRHHVRLSRTFERPAARREFGLYLGGKWYLMKPTVKTPTAQDDPVKALDVSVLSDLVLDKVLGIKDLRKSDRVDFVGGIRGLGELEKRLAALEAASARTLAPAAS